MNFYEFAKAENLPNFRIKQFDQAYFKQLVGSFNEITVFSQELRDTLEKSCNFSSLKMRETLKSESKEEASATTKIAFETTDNLVIEAVLIQEKNRNTVCVSSQVGCPLGCAFCATGNMGFKRNLTSEEIVDQVIFFVRLLKNNDQNITNIVFMGMGEPLLNYENFMKSIEIINSPDKFGLGQRNITISTAGVLPGLADLFSEKKQFHIAISLHAPNQKIREMIMPTAKALPYETLLNFAFAYSNEFHKRITYEYVLLEGINDSIEEAEELASHFIGQEVYTHVNLIMYNETEAAITTQRNKGMILKRCSNNQANRIAEILREHHIPCTIRYSQGEEINSACGQLAGKTNIDN